MKKESKNTNQPKAKKAEIADTEDVIIADETELDDLDQELESLPSDEEPVDAPETNPEPETKTVPGSPEMPNKQKIKILKRTIDTKSAALDRMQTKAKDWRSQADTRDSKAQEEYDKRVKELNDMLKKAETRYNKRIERTRKLWREYTDNYEVTKVKQVEDDIAVLKAKLANLKHLNQKKLQNNSPGSGGQKAA